MKKTLRSVLSIVLTAALLLSYMTGLAYASGTENTGKYVQDVFIAYGKTEAEAKAWLEANGWEPIQGDSDLCAGKNSTFDDPVAAVMGIKRTNDAKNAITDLAVMNMTGGYSCPAYEKLLEKKQAEIDEFINSYMPVIEEYRTNYAGGGSELGKKRAELACEILNRFYDGDPKEPYAAADTGLKLGDLLLADTKQEGGGKGSLDLQQLMLEASTPLLTVVEQMLALATDPGEETWLERLSLLSGNDLAKNLGKYVPEAEGQNISASAAKNFLRQYYGDASRIIAAQWTDIHEEMVWYEKYCDDSGLWDEEGETEEAYQARLDAYFNALKQSDEAQYDKDYNRFLTATIVYNLLYESPYKGEWGDTLGDFFNPYNEKDYGLDADNFLTFAAAMSPGQRVALDMVSLRSLLLIGGADGAGFEEAQPDLDELFGTELEMSVYTGVNRAIFRGGVALTNEAEMDQNSGKGRAYDELYDNAGIWAITSYAAAIVGVPLFVAGCTMYVKGLKFICTT